MIRAHVKFDAYDYQRYGVLEGTIAYLSPDSTVADEGDKRPAAQNRSGTGNSAAAFVVRVKLHANEVRRGERRGRVKFGLSGTAEIVTGRESVLAILIKRLRETISLG